MISKPKVDAPSRERRRRELTEEQKSASDARRAALVARSGPIQTAQKMSVLPWAFFPTVNSALQFQYALETRQVVWHTFHDWKDLGWRVKKGEQGFAIWSAPQKGTEGASGDGACDASAEAPTEGSSSGRSYFRMCYLFHAGQVEPIPDTGQAELVPTIDIEAIQRELSRLMESMTPVEKELDE